jgi:hypothetical protein
MAETPSPVEAPARSRRDRIAALGRQEALGESTLWPAAAAITAACLYGTMPVRFVSGSAEFVSIVRWVVPVLTVALVVPLVLTAPRHRVVQSLGRRRVALAVIAMITAANAVSIVLLVDLIVRGHKVDAHELIRAAIHIWCVNVIVFGLWFWQFDTGGPAARQLTHDQPPDFLFPQQEAPEFAPTSWRPEFLDYLYLSFTNSVAFSPTDAMPLTRWAKMLMLVESATSLLLLVMVAARAVNVLNS